MSHSHAIVWMDSREAHVFRFSAEDVERQRIRSHSPFRKIHHKAGVIGAGHVHLDHGYFDEIAEALDGIQEWLLTGPGILLSVVVPFPSCPKLLKPQDDTVPSLFRAMP